MGEAYHRGTTHEWDIVQLPKTWRSTDSLKYPLTIKKTDGTEVVFENYADHHKFIKQLFNQK